MKFAAPSAFDPMGPACTEQDPCWLCLSWTTGRPQESPRDAEPQDRPGVSRDKA